MNHQMFSRVIIPVDFSQMSCDSLKEALKMVDSPDDLEVVHVTPLPAETAVVWGQVSEEIILARIQEKYAQFAQDGGLPELKFTTLFGDAGSGIADFAKENNATLIIIPSHGRTGMRRVMLGSVAERVVRMSHCPVLVMRNSNDS